MISGQLERARSHAIAKDTYPYLINITRGSRKKYADEFAASGFELLPNRAENQQVEVRKITHEGGALRVDRDDGRLEAALELCGDYVLKTDHNLDGPELWKLYMTLLRAEEGFSALKGSLGLRPNFHQLKGRVDGHIFISVLAYHLLCWIGHRLTQSGDVRDWQTIRRLLRTHNLATTYLPLTDGRVIKVRKPGRPDAEQARVYQRLGIDWKRACPARKFVMK